MGYVKGATPWGRAAVARFGREHPEALRYVEDAIPDGCHVAIAAGRQPGDWVGTLLRGGEVIGRARHKPSIVAACFSAILAGREFAA